MNTAVLDTFLQQVDRDTWALFEGRLRSDLIQHRLIPAVSPLPRITTDYEDAEGEELIIDGVSSGFLEFDRAECSWRSVYFSFMFESPTELTLHVRPSYDFWNIQAEDWFDVVHRKLPESYTVPGGNGAFILRFIYLFGVCLLAHGVIQ